MYPKLQHYRSSELPFTLISSISIITVGHGGALVESIAFNRRVMGSTPALATMYRDLYLQLHVRFGVKLPYSISAVVGSASE